MSTSTLPPPLLNRGRSNSTSHSNFGSLGRRASHCILTRLPSEDESPTPTRAPSPIPPSNQDSMISLFVARLLEAVHYPKQAAKWTELSQSPRTSEDGLLPTSTTNLTFEEKDIEIPPAAPWFRRIPSVCLYAPLCRFDS